MSSRVPGAATMKLVGGSPCLDFVNTVGGRIPAEEGSRGTRPVADKLAVYADLVAWSRHAGTIAEPVARRLERLGRERPQAAAEVLRQAIAFREALHRTLGCLMLARRPAPADLRVVEAEVAGARRHERLVMAEDRLRWEWAGAESRLDSPLWPVARAAADLLTSHDLARLRECSGEQCGWLFLDRSRNRSRQWCTMEDCGNLAKVRRFRERSRRA